LQQLPKLFQNLPV